MATENLKSDREAPPQSDIDPRVVGATLATFVFFALNFGLIMLRIVGPAILLTPWCLAGFGLGAVAVFVIGARSIVRSGAVRARTTGAWILVAIVTGVAMGLLGTILSFFVLEVQFKWIGWHSLLAAPIAALCLPLFRAIHGRR